MVGPYQVLARIGTGGMGEVYLGHDPRLQRRVALKCLTAADTRTGDERARVLREARAAARLSHPHIAAVYDVLEHEGRTFIVMEYVEGESLAARLGRGPLPLDQVQSIGRQLASALAAAHAHGVVHRDLKPANVHFDGARSIKVLDFGVAKLSSPAALDPDEATGGLQAEATIGGTPGTVGYMSPEQLAGREVDGRSDIYSAGVMLFEMATGRRPFEERRAVPLALAISSRPAPRASTLDPDVPPDLDEAIARALERDPKKRWQSAADLASALAAVPSSDAGGRPPGRAGARRNAVPAATALLVAILFAVALWNRRPPPASEAPPKRLVVAVLPVENPGRDAQGEYFGAGLASVIARNFGSIPGVTVISREATAAYRLPRDADRLRRELGADYAIRAVVNAPPPQAQVVASLWKAAKASDEWEEVFAGDPLTVEREILARLTSAFDASAAWPQRLSDRDRRRLLEGPTTSPEALNAFSEARGLLDHRGNPGNLARAVGLLERTLELDPDFQLALAALAEAYLEQYRVGRDPDFAAKANDAVMRALRASAGDDPWIYQSLGNVQWSTGRYQDAVQSLRRSLELQPDNDETHALLAKVLADRNELDAAIDEVRRAIQLRPEYWRPLMTLASFYYRAGRFPEALDAYGKAAELQPNDPGPFSGLGLVHHVLGNLPLAVGNYEHAVQLGPSASAYSNLGVVYYTAGRYDEAVEAWQHALELEPRNVLYRRNVGDAYRRLKQPQLAAAAYRDAIAAGEARLQVNPRDVETISLVAVCEAKLGRAASAARRAAEAVALAPTNRVALQRSAEVNALLGHADAALADLKAAIDRGYSRSTARDNDEFQSLKKLPAFQTLVGDSTTARRE